MEKPILELIGHDGNAFAILGRARKIAIKTWGQEKWEEIRAEATSGNYDNLLATMDKYFEVE